MVKATRRRDESEETREPEPARIVVTNVSRTQPLTFQYRGTTVRLGPLESREMERSCLASPELAHLVSTAAVTVADGPRHERDRSDSTTAGEK